jgi:hypothetical protein
MLWYVIRTSHPEYARHRLISKALSIFRSTWRSSCRRHDAGLFQNPEYTNEQKLFGNRQICPVHWSTRRCRSLRQTNVYRENSCHWSRSKRNMYYTGWQNIREPHPVRAASAQLPMPEKTRSKGKLVTVLITVCLARKRVRPNTVVFRPSLRRFFCVTAFTLRILFVCPG